PLLLRRARLARGGLREPARGRPAAGHAAAWRLGRRPRGRAARALCDGRRVLRPPPALRRDGAGDGGPAAGDGRRRDADHPPRVPGRASADPRGGDPRAHLVVLRPRRRALAQRLRLPRARHHAPALARAAAREPRLAARRDRRLLRDARGHLAQGSVGGARRLRQRAPRPQPPAARRLLRPPPAVVARSHRAAGGAPPPRAAAEPPAHVHLVRLVLRRAVGDRAGADPSLRGHGAPVPRRPRRPAAGGRVRAPPGHGAHQRARLPRRRRRVEAPHPSRRGGPAPRDRPLRDHRARRGAARRRGRVRLPRGTGRRGARGGRGPRGERGARAGAGARPRQADAPIPEALALVARHVLSQELLGELDRFEFAGDAGPLPARLFDLAGEATALGLTPDLADGKAATTRMVARALDAVADAPTPERVAEALALIEGANRL